MNSISSGVPQVVISSVYANAGGAVRLCPKIHVHMPRCVEQDLPELPSDVRCAKASTEGECYA